MGSAEAGVGSALHLGISLHPLLLAPPFPQVPSPAHSVTSIPHTELHRRGCLSRRVTYSRTTPFRWTLAPSRPGTQVRRLGRSALLASSPLCYGVPLSAWTDGRMTHGKVWKATSMPLATFSFSITPSRSPASFSGIHSETIQKYAQKAFQVAV